MVTIWKKDKRQGMVYTKLLAQCIPKLLVQCITNKSSLERVSNAERGCIDSIYRELRHKSAINIILRFLAK